MAWRRVSSVKVPLWFTAAFLLLGPKVLAGEHVRAGDSPARVVPPAPAPAPRALPRSPGLSVVVTPTRAGLASVPPSPTLSVVVTPRPQPAAEPVYVAIRGPDGQVRRFPLAGGRAAIQVQEIVLRPGQSVTLQWTAAR